MIRFMYRIKALPKSTRVHDALTSLSVTALTVAGRVKDSSSG